MSPSSRVSGLGNSNQLLADCMAIRQQNRLRHLIGDRIATINETQDIDILTTQLLAVPLGIGERVGRLRGLVVKGI